VALKKRQLVRAGHFIHKERGAIRYKIVAMDANKANATYKTVSQAIEEGFEPLLGWYNVLNH